MKLNIIQMLLLILMAITVNYALFAFVNLDLNVTHWRYGDRFFLGGLIITNIAIIIANTKLKKI